MASIAQLLIDLAKDDARAKDRRAKFEADREGFMRRRRLTKGQRDIVMSGDLGIIRNALRYEYATGLVRDRLYKGRDEKGEPVRLFIVWTPKPPPPPDP
jgi:hypothetical protein